MPDAKPVTAPKYMVNKDGKVVDADTSKEAEGIVIFGKPALVSPPDESPLAAMVRWRNFRQTTADK